MQIKHHSHTQRHLIFACGTWSSVVPMPPHHPPSHSKSDQHLPLIERDKPPSGWSDQDRLPPLCGRWPPRKMTLIVILLVQIQTAGHLHHLWWAPTLGAGVALTAAAVTWCPCSLRASEYLSRAFWKASGVICGFFLAASKVVS